MESGSAWMLIHFCSHYQGGLLLGFVESYREPKNGQGPVLHFFGQPFGLSRPIA
jgi:hypothetical protein